jgi:uncharacterized protein (TIGR02996 family)
MRFNPELLRAVLEDADEDPPRLAYAEWLENHGEADRAELIRLQCELIKLPSHDPRRGELQARERALLEKHAPEWIDSRSSAGVNFQSFQRGFVERITCRENYSRWGEAARQLVESFEELLSQEPVQELAFFFPPIYSEMLCLEFGLNPYGPFIDLRTLRELTHLPSLAQLRWLSLHNGGIGDSGAQILAASPYLTNLRVLDLNMVRQGPQITEIGARALAESPSLTQLAELHLIGNAISGAGFQALIDSPNLKGLRKLCAMGLPEGYPETWRSIRSIDNVGVQAIATSPGAIRLTCLNIASNELNDLAAQALANSPYLANLTELDVTENNFSPEASQLLLARFGDRVQLRRTALIVPD